MRITGGIYKGKQLIAVKNPSVRPTKAIVREALFSILGPGYCHGKVVLDLFSGSGIIAIEALSRGALEVVCVDVDCNSCTLIRANFKSFNISSSVTLLHMSATQAISHFSSLGKKFDLIFSDPPYATPEMGVNVNEVACRSEILELDALTVLEHTPKIDLPPCQSMSIWKQKKYGHSMLTFYNRKN